MIRITDIEQIQLDLENCSSMVDDINEGFTNPTPKAMNLLRKVYEKYAYEYIEYRKYLAKLKQAEETQKASVKQEIIESFGQQYKQTTLDDVIALNLVDGTLTLKQLTNNE